MSLTNPSLPELRANVSKESQDKSLTSSIILVASALEQFFLRLEQLFMRQATLLDLGLFPLSIL